MPLSCRDLEGVQSFSFVPPPTHFLNLMALPVGNVAATVSGMMPRIPETTETESWTPTEILSIF